VPFYGGATFPVLYLSNFSNVFCSPDRISLGKLWTPLVTVMTAIGFYGLDQLGAELEGPFGTEDNDFPLLFMGANLCDDLDAMVRTLRRDRVIDRKKAVTEADSKNLNSKLGWSCHR